MWFEVFVYAELPTIAIILATSTIQLWSCGGKKKLEQQSNEHIVMAVKAVEKETDANNKEKGKRTSSDEKNRDVSVSNKKQEKQEYEKKEEENNGKGKADERNNDSEIKEKEEQKKEEILKQSFATSYGKYSKSSTDNQGLKENNGEINRPKGSIQDDFGKNLKERIVETNMPTADVKLDDGRYNTETKTAAKEVLRPKGEAVTAAAERVANLAPKEFAKGAKEREIAKGSHKNRLDYKAIGDTDSDKRSEYKDPKALKGGNNEEKKGTQNAKDNKSKEASDNLVKTGRKCLIDSHIMSVLTETAEDIADSKMEKIKENGGKIEKGKSEKRVGPPSENRSSTEKKSEKNNQNGERNDQNGKKETPPSA